MPDTTPNSTHAKRFTLIVHASGQATTLAQRFAIAVAASPHQIEQIFFYHDGVLQANTNRSPAQDDPQTIASWQALANAGDFALNVCIAAAARRGVLSAAEAQRHGKPSGNLADGFELVGLGVFIEGLINADRVVTFGS